MKDEDFNDFDLFVLVGVAVVSPIDSFCQPRALLLKERKAEKEGILKEET